MLRTIKYLALIIFSILLIFQPEKSNSQTTLSTLNFPDPHVGSALITDDFGFISDLRVGTKAGDSYSDVQWINYLTKFVMLNGGTPIEIKSGTANLTTWDNIPAAPVANGYFIPARFESWTYDAINSPNVWNSVIEYENGGDHIIGGIGYKLLDPSPTFGYPYAELNPAYQFTNVGAANATLKTIHYERNAQTGNSVYSNHGGGQWDYDNTDGTSDDYVAVSTAVSNLGYFSFAGFPLEMYRIQSSALDLLNELQNAAANYNLVNSTNMVLNAPVEISFQISEITLAPGEAVLYWLYPKPIKVINTANEYPTNIDYEKKTINSTGVDYAFNNTDVSINYSGINYKTSGANVTATAMNATVAEITGGIVQRNVTGALDHVSTVRYWEIFYDTRRQSTTKDITFTYDPATDGITDEDSLTLAYRTDYSQDWTEWIGAFVDNNNNTITAISVNLGDSQWILATKSTNNPLPVELTSFTADVTEHEIVLYWLTTTETDNYGFEIERLFNNSWGKIGFVEGHGNSNSPQKYSFTDDRLKAGQYYYRIKQIDTDGTFTYSKQIKVIFGAPSQYVLMQNFPNPFNPSTTISYKLPKPAKVKLIVCDVSGREVCEITNSEMPAGFHSISWNGKNNGSDVAPSGLYFYRIETDDFIESKKMLYIH